MTTDTLDATVDTPAAADYAPLLSSPRVQLWPWVRGMWPRETPFRLWSFLEAERVGSRIFWGIPGLQPMVVADLIEFTRFLEPERGSRLILMVQAIEAPPEQAFAGLIWFDELMPDWKAIVGIWIRRRYWGAVAHEASALAKRYVFARYRLREVWAFTPWKPARRHAERLGFQLIARLPQFLCIDGAYLDLMALRLERDGGRDG